MKDAGDAVETGGTQRHTLDVFFRPRHVALIGATDRPGSVGSALLTNLVSYAFGGRVFPVNPKHEGLMGLRAYPDIGSVPEPVDLAIIATPAPTVPEVVKACAAAGVAGAVIVSAGFKETGPAGVALEQRVLVEARRTGMRVLGPNCLGVMNPVGGFNGTFAHALAHPGRVAFLSQSGALGTAILDWSLRQNVGFSAFVSVGSMLDVGWAELIDYLGGDPQTQSILMYMESIGDARAFLSAAREVALSKPIIVLKAGRTAAAAQAAASHTGALTGSDDVLTAAFRRVGVLRVDTIDELFGMAEVLAKQPRPASPRVTIVTNAGGPGALATDALIAGGGELASLSAEGRTALDAVLPPHWSRANPIDVLGDAGPERYAKALEVVAREPQSDGVLVILALQAMTNPLETARRVAAFAGRYGKPVLTSWMGGLNVASGREILNQAEIPTFESPDAAARAFGAMWRHSEALASLYETPMPPTGVSAAMRASMERLLREARAAGRTLLSELESKQLLAAWGIATTPIRAAASEDDAVARAAETGYPCVLKLHSTTLTHKRAAGGVALDLRDADAVRTAWRAMAARLRDAGRAADFQGVTVQPMVAYAGPEVILGSSTDAQFGPVLMVGWGGALVETLRDAALALPPLTTTLVRRTLEQTRVYAALRGAAGGADAASLRALELLVVKFGQLVMVAPAIREIEINPLVAMASGDWMALDARVVLHGPDVPDAQLPRPAIRPYPAQYAAAWTARDGEVVMIRPIRPDDEPLMVKFHETLSETSVYSRYFRQIPLNQRTAHRRLTRVCFNDYDREIALVAERALPAGAGVEIVAIGRLIKVPGRGEAEFALLVGDQHQRLGLGTELLRRLVQVGRDERVGRIVCDVLASNGAMLRVCERVGFARVASGGSDVVHVVIELG